MKSAQPFKLKSVTLDDKYTVDKGRIYASGTQVLARLPMLQKQMDEARGLNTGGFISGYRGSPLGGLDMALWQAQDHLQKANIKFQPGLNEDLAATSVWGSQQVNLSPGSQVDGIFGLWYGKGPGVDRSGDVLKHANSAGTDANGGVLMLVGDDHAAKSSSIAHQSEHLLIACGIPVLYPTNVQEYLDYGLHGWAMSRYSGLWVAMKCVTDVVESSASVEVDLDRVQTVIPNDFELPQDGLNIRWPDSPLEQEARMHERKWYAALAYIRANKLNQIVIDSPRARFGIMAAGKAYLDVRQALADLGLDDVACEKIGIRLMKVGCVWPLDAQITREFATGLEEILVVEEKRQILEYAVKEELYNWREDVRPRVFGKFDERENAGGEWSTPRGNWLLPACNELSPSLIATAIASRLDHADLSAEIKQNVRARIELIELKEREQSKPVLTAKRTSWFCSGCPHNISTKVPEGSKALAGIGCHYMAMWMDRDTETFTQMGGEGISWLGQMHFTSTKHVFVNLGDGTYFHSGLLAIRAAISAKANITYKILFNDAVAMTGGQPVDGVLTVPMIAQQVVAEGAKRVLIVSNNPQRFSDRKGLPDLVSVHHRDEFDDLQLELRETLGTSVLIYDQACATESRRRRKRGLETAPKQRAFINSAVCEGCGDCSVKSNCLSIEPLETEFGTKRRINQNSCNIDLSCVKGFCPSFVTVEGAVLKKPDGAGDCDASSMPEIFEPEPASLDSAVGIVVTGVGGTGVVTIGSLLGMAAHLEGKGVTVLDQTGLAQKGGAVLSHIQIAKSPSDIFATRIATAEAQVLIGCDGVVSASAAALSRVCKGVTNGVINGTRVPTADFLANPDWQYPADSIEREIDSALGDNFSFIEANALAEKILGDSIFSNPIMLGYAWQKAWLPLSREALLRAIELNGVAVEKNKLAFEWGRVAAAAPEKLPVSLIEQESPNKLSTLEELLESRCQHLKVYQNEKYAQRYRKAVEQVQRLEKSVLGTHTPPSGLSLSWAVAENLSRLMAYKDEYEVARLHARPEFLAELREQFEGEPGVDYKLNYHLAPPVLSKRDQMGHLIKSQFGSWMLHAFRVLARFKPVRGTMFDIFSKTQERKEERRLIDEYFELLTLFSDKLNQENYATAVTLAELPEKVRGFGHVKDKNMQLMRVKQEQLLKEFNSLS